MKEERAIKRKKRKIKFFIKLGIFLLLCGLIVFLLKSPLFDVKEFTVEGNSYYTDDEILVMGNCKTGGNIFIGTDVRDIKSRLEKDAYMASVKVKRILPDTIKIQLDERRQVAAIVYGEKYVVVDGSGTVQCWLPSSTAPKTHPMSAAKPIPLRMFRQASGIPTR